MPRLLPAVSVVGAVAAKIASVSTRPDDADGGCTLRMVASIGLTVGSVMLYTCAPVSRSPLAAQHLCLIVTMRWTVGLSSVKLAAFLACAMAFVCERDPLIERTTSDSSHEHQHSRYHPRVARAHDGDGARHAHGRDSGVGVHGLPCS